MGDFLHHGSKHLTTVEVTDGIGICDPRLRNFITV